MTVVHFTADLHLGHQLVAGLRGYGDPDEHDAVVMSNLRTMTRPGDTLWILGGISSGSSAGERAALARLATLRDDGRTLHLIAGNHDGVHPMHRGALKWDEAYRAVFASVQPFARRRINRQRVWLSHFPWRGGGDHTDTERYSTVRLGDDGTSWLMHGHTHSLHKIDRERRMIHVGLDAWALQPVPMHTITDLIGDQP